MFCRQIVYLHILRSHVVDLCLEFPPRGSMKGISGNDVSYRGFFLMQRHFSKTEVLFCYRGISSHLTWINFIQEHFVFVFVNCSLLIFRLCILHLPPAATSVLLSEVRLSGACSSAKIKLLVVVVVVVAMVRVKSLYRVACPDQWVDPLLTCQITLQSL